MMVKDSARLSYELITRDDAGLLYELDNDPEVMRYITGGKVSTMDDIQNIYLPRMESYVNEAKGWGLWKVTVKESNDFIGWVLVRPMEFFSDSPEYDNIELGWRFMQKAWGKGFATEAARAVKEALIQDSNPSYLTAIAEDENLGSINIMKKLGMEYIKTYLHKDPLGDAELVYYQLKLA